MFHTLQNQYSCSFSRHETITVSIKWSTGLGRISLKTTKCPDNVKPSEAQTTYTCFTPTPQNNISSSSPDYLSSLSYCLISCSTRGNDSICIPLEPKYPTYLCSSHIREDHGNKKWTHTHSSFIKQSCSIFLCSGKSSIPVSHNNTQTLPVFLR